MSNSVAKKKWTFMVYLTGDNNLDANGNAGTQALIASARNRVQEFAVNDNVDLINFCQLLNKTNLPV